MNPAPEIHQIDNSCHPMSEADFSYENYDETADYDIENSVNVLNPKDPTDMGNYHRLMIQGKCVKLPNTETIDDDLYQNFLSGWMSDIKDDEEEKAKVFKYIWKSIYPKIQTS